MIDAFLRAVGTKAVSATSSHVTAKCPLAPWTHNHGTDSRPSFAISVKPTEESRFNCFTCRYGTLVELVMELYDSGAEPPKYDIKRAMELAVADGERDIAFNVKSDFGVPRPIELEDDVRFPEAFLEQFPSAMRIKRAYAYATSRGLSDETIRFLDLRYDLRNDAVGFPIRDWKGVLRQFRVRRLDPDMDQSPYHVHVGSAHRYHKTVWFGENWIDTDLPVVMCESVFDVAAVIPVYRNVCAPMSASLSRAKVRRMRKCEEIVLFFDDDGKAKAGDTAREKIRRGLSQARITDAAIRGRNRFDRSRKAKDPGEMFPKLIHKSLSRVLPKRLLGGT